MKKLFLTVAVALMCLSAVAQVRVVGHRGCRFNTPSEPETPLYENTLAALKFAQSLGIYAAEFDVQLTSDGKPIVFHGPIVPGIKKDIHTITFDEARAAKLPGGNRMPTLEEYFKQAKKNPAMKIICEIKKQPTPEGETSLVEQTMALAAKMKMQEQIEYTSFSEWACAEIKRVDPSVKVIFIESGLNVHTPEYCKEKGYDGISYDINGFLNHPDYVTRAKALGIETTLWVVNDWQLVNWAIFNGIDFVSSDHPEKMQAYVNGIGKAK